MNATNLIIITSLLLLLSCQPKAENQIDDYTVKYFSKQDDAEMTVLKGEKFPLIEFINPRHILALDDHLVIVENELNNIFYLYRQDTKEFVRSFGVNAMGPGEIFMASRPHIGIDRGDFWTYDATGRSINKYNIYNDTSKLAILQIRQRESFSGATSFLPISDSVFMTQDMSDEHKFVQINIGQNQREKYGNWNDMDPSADLPLTVLFTIYQGSEGASRDGRYFGICGSISDFIEILDKETGKIVSIRGPANEYPDFDVDDSRGWVSAEFRGAPVIKYRSIYLGENSVFGLYSGATNKESIENQKSYVFEFDFQGNLLSEYLLDYAVLSFSIDEKTKTIFGISHDEDRNLVAFQYE
ncbi:BF3164 family lipoprotein [Algoriphagus aquimarinus]|uniref:BF3164 family lipoprotein n=1 Tax=Algoriphagus aquimarinus TaxID=237018 RepID=UPI0030D71460|tara:strand:- start:48633 stop:49700 length:1068 start_codon:yes stop_codon:yes gene_type:complete